jgi:hypothetical protein
VRRAASTWRRDGRIATLRDVVDHYDEFFRLGLTDQESDDLVEYLKSLPGREPLRGGPRLPPRAAWSP